MPPIADSQHLELVRDAHTDSRTAQRRTLTVLVAAQICTAAAVTIGFSVAGLIAADLAGNEGAAGLAQTVTVLGAAIVAVPLGRIAATTGRRPALLSGLLLALGGGATVVVATAVRSLPLLLIGLLAFGAASAANLQARYAATDLAPRGKVARSLAIVVWASTIGTVLGPNLAGPADRLGTALALPELTGPFAFSVVSLAAASAIMAFLPRPAAPAATGAPAAAPRLRVAARAAFANPVTRTSLVVVAASHMAMVAVMTMTPAHIQHSHHVSHGGTADDQHVLTLIGIVISLHTVGMFAFSPLVGWLADKIGTRPVILTGLGTLAAGAGLAALAQGSAPMLSAGLFLLGLGWSCGLIGGSARLSVSTEPALRPAVQGISDMFMNAAAAVGGALAGVVVATMSYGALGLLTVGLIAAGTAGVTYSHYHQVRRDSQTRSAPSPAAPPAAPPGATPTATS